MRGERPFRTIGPSAAARFYLHAGTHRLDSFVIVGLDPAIHAGANACLGMSGSSPAHDKLRWLRFVGTGLGRPRPAPSTAHPCVTGGAFLNSLKKLVFLLKASDGGSGACGGAITENQAISTGWRRLNRSQRGINRSPALFQLRSDATLSRKRCATMRHIVHTYASLGVALAISSRTGIGASSFWSTVATI